MAETNKEHVTTILSRCESVGLLMKGTTANVLENYDFIVAEIEKEKLAAEEAAKPAPEVVPPKKRTREENAP